MFNNVVWTLFNYMPLLKFAEKEPLESHEQHKGSYSSK